jgi:hypothetical protein
MAKRFSTVRKYGETKAAMADNTNKLKMGARRRIMRYGKMFLLNKNLAMQSGHKQHSCSHG